MADNRELILARIQAVCLNASDFETSVRNRGLLSNEKRPACILLDGDEVQRLSLDLPRGHRGRAMLMAPQIMNMTPELYILLKEGRPTNENVGQELNAKRIALLAALSADTALADLIGPNGNMVLSGCTTDLKSGSALTGQMRMDFSILYVLKPLG